MDDQELKIREAVVNIWGCLDSWEDTVRELSYDKIVRIYKAAVYSGLIEEEV